MGGLTVKSAFSTGLCDARRRQFRVRDAIILRSMGAAAPPLAVWAEGEALCSITRQRQSAWQSGVDSHEIDPRSA
jgi:hypothetical protein